MGHLPDRSPQPRHPRRALYKQQLPLVEKAFREESLSLGEACAIATSTEKATADWAQVRDNANEGFRETHPDTDEYRARLEYGLIAYKSERPNVSVRQLRQATQWFVARLDPDKADREYDESFEERGAQLSQTYGGSFLLRMWGPAADLEKINAARQAYTQPYGPDNAAIPKHQRDYDALMNGLETALGHRECAKAPQPLATINITVPLKRFLGDGTAEPAVTEDGVVLPDQMVTRLAPQSWLRRFLTDETGRTLLDVGQKKRCAPDPVRQAAGFKESSCQWPQGCDVPRSWSQYDHIVPFSQGGATSADNMQILCSTHNRLKHRLQAKLNRKIWEHHHNQNRQGTETSGDREGKGSHPQPPLSDFHQAKAPTSSTRPEAEPPPTTPTRTPLSGSDPKGTVPCGAISMPRARAPPARTTGPPAVATPLPLPVPLPPPPTTGAGNTRPTRKRDQCRGHHHPRCGYRHQGYLHHHCYRPTGSQASAWSGCHQCRPPQGRGPPSTSLYRVLRCPTGHVMATRSTM